MKDHFFPPDHLSDYKVKLLGASEFPNYSRKSISSPPYDMLRSSYCVEYEENA